MKLVNVAQLRGLNIDEVDSSVVENIKVTARVITKKVTQFWLKQSLQAHHIETSLDNRWKRDLQRDFDRSVM